jgi:hypothetical protein
MASLVHLALNETDENHPPTIWGDHVTDEEYTAPNPDLSSVGRHMDACFAGPRLHHDPAARPAIPISGESPRTFDCVTSAQKDAAVSTRNGQVVHLRVRPAAMVSPPPSAAIARCLAQVAVQPSG